MPSQLEIAYANFDKMKPAQKKELDDALAFLTNAQMPTTTGAQNREMLKKQPINPDSLRAIGAYRAYKFKLEHKPDEQGAQMMRLKGVPDAEIAKVNSREKWEQDQLGSFDQLATMIKPHEMAAENITASAQKSKPKPRAEKMDLVRAVPAATPVAAPPAMAGAEGAPMPVASPQPQAVPVAPQTEGTLPLYSTAPVLEDKRLPLGAQLGGQIG